jgi:hypothetical protein
VLQALYALYSELSIFIIAVFLLIALSQECIDDRCDSDVIPHYPPQSFLIAMPSCFQVSISFSGSILMLLGAKSRKKPFFADFDM